MSLTDQVDELPAGAVLTDHRVVTKVEVLVDGAVERVLTEVTDGSVTLDRTAAVRGRMDLTLVATDNDLVPTGPDSLLAPYGNEVRISRGIALPDGDQLVRLGVFRIDNAGSPDGQTVRLSGLDRAAKFSGADGAFEHAGQVPSGFDAQTAIYLFLLEIYPDLRINFAARSVALPLLGYEEGEDRWAFCQGIAQSLGGELYFDRNGEATLQPTPDPLAGDPVAVIEEGPGGAMLGAERNWDRGEVFNRVVVTGENPDSSDVTPRGVRLDNEATSPTYYYGSFGRKTYTWQNTFISTNDQAADAAAGILARTMGAPDIVSFSTIPDPARAPSDVVRIIREDLGLAEDHVLDQVTIPLGAEGTMTAQTRAAQVLL